MEKGELIDIFQIIEQANNMGIMFFDCISLRADLSVARQEFNLRLKVSSNSDDVNFVHDVVDIRSHIDRGNKRMGDGSLSKYSNL